MIPTKTIPTKTIPTKTLTTKSAVLVLSLALVGAGLAASSLPANYNKRNADVQGVVRYGTFEGGDSILQLQKVVAAFNKVYPKVQVKIEAVPTDYGTKLINQIAAGTAPDIFQIGDGDARLFVDKGGAQDLTTYFSGRYGLNRSVFYPNVLAIGAVEGKQYYLPKDWTGVGIYYNKALFKAAGVQAPKAGWTWDDFTALAQKLTDKSKNQFGAVFWNELGTRAMYPLVLGQGGDYISKDGTRIQGVFDSPATIRAYNFVADLVAKGVVPDRQYLAANGGPSDAFNGGHAAMWYFGVWPMRDFINVKAPSFDWGVLPMPRFKGTKPYNAIFWSGLAMYKNSRNKDAAWEFLKYISGPEGSQILKFPNVKVVAEDIVKAEPRFKPFFIDAASNFTALPEFRTRFFNDSLGKFYKYVDDASLAGTKDFTEAIKKAAADAQRELDRLRAENK